MSRRIVVILVEVLIEQFSDLGQDGSTTSEPLLIGPIGFVVEETSYTMLASECIGPHPAERILPWCWK